MQQREIVLSAVGPDRPGLVKHISEAIHDAGCNLEDSRMAILGGDFAVLVLFSGSDDAIGKVEGRREELEKELGLQLRFKEATPRGEEQGCSVYNMEVTGVDQPGIVHNATSILADLGVNVASLESRLVEAAFHGTPMFELRAVVQVPVEQIVDELAERLEELCDTMDLSCSFTRETDQ